jgi:Pretoxin HINT domain
MNTVLENVTPCGKALRLAVALKGLSAANAVGSALNAQEALANGDILGFMDGTLGAYSGFNKLGQSCFTAGTPLLTPDGSKPIEQFQVGDLILSRDEHDADGPVTVRRVVDTFTRIGPVLNVHVGGRIIETTREHPFYVDGNGWRTAHELQIGDVLLSHDGLRVAVEGVADSGKVETVYNLEVEEHHTYFVGAPEWGLDVWSHNYRPGQHGLPDHRRTVESLVAKAKKEFKGRDVTIHRGTTVAHQPNTLGLNRRPDVWVESNASQKVLKVYEAARKNIDGTFVKRERIKRAQYDAAGLIHHFEGVK